MTVRLHLSLSLSLSLLAFALYTLSSLWRSLASDRDLSPTMMTATMLLAAYIRGRHIDGLSSESPHVSDDDDDDDDDDGEFVYSLLFLLVRFRPISHTVAHASTRRGFICHRCETLIRYVMFAISLPCVKSDTIQKT